MPVKCFKYLAFTMKYNDKVIECHIIIRAARLQPAKIMLRICYPSKRDYPMSNYLGYYLITFTMDDVNLSTVFIDANISSDLFSSLENSQYKIGDENYEV